MLWEAEQKVHQPELIMRWAERKLHKKYSKEYVKRVNLFFLYFCIFQHKLTI